MPASLISTSATHWFSFWTTCSGSMRPIPYATLTHAFRELMQQQLAESEARIADWRHRLQAAVGINGQLIVDVLSQVALIIGPQAPVPTLPPTEAQNRLRLVFRQFVSSSTCSRTRTRAICC